MISQLLRVFCQLINLVVSETPYTPTLDLYIVMPFSQIIRFVFPLISSLPTETQCLLKRVY